MAEATVNGVRLAYDVHGTGEPVVLVCGTGQGAFAWNLSVVPSLLQAGFQVVTFDNRGMAPSECPEGPYSIPMMVEDTAALIEHLGFSGVRVAGYSMGAMITQELALARPDLVRAACMIGTFGRKDAYRKALTESWVEHDLSGIKLPPRVDAVMAAAALYSPTTLNNEAIMSMIIEGMAAMPPWDGPGRLGQHQADVAYDDRLEALKGITVPSRVVAFELDMGTAAYLGKEVADAIGCEYIEIAGCGHAGLFEKPAEVSAAIVEFFTAV
jgi:pimeloyl-ACP methyl ester carboxylesterase